MFIGKAGVFHRQRPLCMVLIWGAVSAKVVREVSRAAHSSRSGAVGQKVHELLRCMVSVRIYSFAVFSCIQLKAEAICNHITSNVAEH